MRWCGMRQSQVMNRATPLHRRRKRGRPASDPDAVGPLDYHLGLRFDQRRGEQIRLLLVVANRQVRGRRAGPKVTASSLVARWIRERLDAEIRSHGLVHQVDRFVLRELQEAIAQEHRDEKRKRKQEKQC
jgi:hypothetical protein